MAWREIAGWKYLYRVSDTGRCQRRLTDGTWKEVKPFHSHTCAQVYMRGRDNKTYKRSLPRLVWEAFRGKIPEGMLVGVINGVRLDCDLSNLYLTTPRKINIGKRPTNSRPVAKINRFGKAVAFYGSAREAAQKNFVSESSMREHCSGKSKDPYSLDGYKYIYDDRRGGRRGYE